MLLRSRPRDAPRVLSRPSIDWLRCNGNAKLRCCKKGQPCNDGRNAFFSKDDE